MKIGIIGNGGIVQAAMSVMKSAGIEMCALWCRNMQKGKPLADEYNCTLYTDFDAFLRDPSFDTVYIGLINSLHYEYARKALLAHKHCIVEKPFTTTAEEAEDLYRLSEENEVMLFEAIMSRYSRNYESVREHLSELGEIKLVRSTYCQYSRRYNDYLAGKILPAFDPALSGGALYDINVYNIHFNAGLFGMPAGVQYTANIGYNGIDTSGAALLDYGSFKAVCTGAKDCSAPNGSYIQGDKGYIECPGRPGMISNVTLHLNDGTVKELDVCSEPNPMLAEFEKIREVIDQNNRKLADQWMKSTLDVMNILVWARKDADIVFGDDN